MLYDDWIEAGPQTDTIYKFWSRNMQLLDDILSEARFDKLQNVYLEMTLQGGVEMLAASTLDAMKKTRERKSLHVVKPDPNKHDYNE
ncbi:hypothetical protein AX16_005804 [Volvariella volvacea WC 439]|nr:hypothetical protein AX16_005804 [Volvariella volvacea WC 439]